MKQILSVFLACLMLFSLVACSSQTTSEGSKLPDQSQQNQGTPSADNPTTYPAKEVTFGNLPNNLLQSTSSLCFAENRVFFLNSDHMLCSLQMDGTDLQEHCPINQDSLFPISAKLNAYAGGIYFTEDIEATDQDTVDSCEIRRYDLASGTVETVYSVAGASAENMLIINDTLCFAYYLVDVSTRKGRVYVEVLDLTSGKTNALIDKSTNGYGGNFGFDTDGTYLYLIWNGGINDRGLHRVLLSEIFDEDPDIEQLFGRPYYPESYLLDNGGLYAVIRESDDRIIYGCYSHEALSGDKFTLAPEELSTVSYDQDNLRTEQSKINNLAFDTGTKHYLLGNARVSVRSAEKGCLEIFYSDNLDWRASVLVAEPTHRTTLYIQSCYALGEYQDVLYIVLEGEDGTPALHTLTADGKYQ